jgi:uncharacterized membrane protein YfcA
VLGYPIDEIAWLVAWIVAGGIVTGLLAGLFGIGGGGIIVPVLYEVFGVMQVSDDVRMQLCIGTSIAIIVPTTIRSYAAHKARGAVVPDVVRLWAAPAIAGVLLGAALAAFAPGWVFKIAFVVLALFIAFRMLFAQDRWRLGADLPKGPLMRFYGFLVGLASALMGVSGGSVSNMVLTLYGKPIHSAVATSAGVGVPITIAGALGYMVAGWPHIDALPPLSIGFVSLIGFVVMAPVASFTASYGARLAHWLPRRQLEIGFGCFLILVSLRFVVSLF